MRDSVPLARTKHLEFLFLYFLGLLAVQRRFGDKDEFFARPISPANTLTEFRGFATLFHFRMTSDQRALPGSGRRTHGMMRQLARLAFAARIRRPHVSYHPRLD
jgi:hypothetical protein